MAVREIGWTENESRVRPFRSPPCQRREAAFNFGQHDRQVAQRVALQGRGGHSPLVVVEVMGKVELEVRMV